MKSETKKGGLRPLLALLSQCPSRDESISHALLTESWDRLRNESLRHITTPSPAIMAALVLNDRTVGRLLTGSEHGQLLELANLAIERYEQRNSAHNKIGNLIAAILKEPQ
jgi:hypothetical protein